ncbi:MAG: DegV family protein [Bacilli bacterium]
MSEKIAVIVCGNSGIDYINHPYKIDVFRSLLYVNGEEFEDFIDISAEAFYERLIKEPNTNVSTSQTATGRMLEVYQRLETEGYTDAIVVTISSHLSGTYQNAVLAGKMADTLRVHIFDSQTAAFAEAKMALVAAEMAKNGKTVSEIIERLEFIRDNNRVYFAVDTLKYLVKNGRLSAAKGFMGSLLKLKPLLVITKEGKIVAVKKIRTSVKAINHVKEQFYDETKGLDFEPFIIYTNNIELANNVANEIMEHYPNIKNVGLYPLTPVVGAHTGPGAFGIGYIINK